MNVELEFDWDPDKERINMKKHRVSFLRAAEIFSKPVLYEADDREDHGEERIIAVGQSGGNVYRVIFTWRAVTSSASSARRGRIDMSEKPTIVRYTMSQIQEKIARGEDETDPNAPEAADDLGPDFWKNAKVAMITGKTSVHLRLDSDIVEWFRSHGKGHLTRMNAVLRAYVDAHKKSA